MSGQLPTWLAERLGLDTSSGGDGATWQLISAWRRAPWVTLLLVLFAVAWIVAIYAREQATASRLYRAILIALRLTTLTILLVMLAQWAIGVRLTGPPAIALIIDHSASMGLADKYADSELSAKLAARLKSTGLDEATRLNIAKLVLNEGNGKLLAELAARYRLNVYVVADNIERLRPRGDFAELGGEIAKLAADGADTQHTRLGEAVRRVLDDLRGNPPAAIILLTDGVTTAGLSLADAAADARRWGVPLISVGLGSDEPPRDIEVTEVLADDAVFAGDIVTFQVQVKASGLDNQPAQIRLRRQRSTDDAAAGGEVISEQTIQLPATGQTQSVQLSDRPETPGNLTYLIEVTPRDDETNQDNNRQTHAVAVHEDKIRVLLAQGYPNYEFRYLKTLLDRDPTVELASYLQDADPDYATQDKSALRSFPVGRDELFQYDVLIIGDVDPTRLPRSVWQNVRAFVAEKGGGVAFVAGPRFMPWSYGDNADVASILPVELRGLRTTTDSRAPNDVGRSFSVQPTAIGLVSPPLELGDTRAETETIWAHLAPQYWLAAFERTKPAAQVLAEQAGGARRWPVICFQYVGAGRVLLHAIDSTWLWRRGAGDKYFSRYWVQAIRFLARGKLNRGRGIELATDRREYHQGEPVQVRGRILDPQAAPAAESLTVAIESAGQARRRIELRRRPGTEGLFEATLSDLTAGQFQALLTDPQLPGNPPTARFSVTAPPGEFARPEMDRAALAAAAEMTHGKFYTIADADRLLSELPAGRRTPLENLPPISLWNRWWMMAAFLICLTSEWILRKRKGML